MPVREGFLEEAASDGDLQGDRGWPQLGPGKSIPSRRHSKRLRQVAVCGPHLPKPGFLMESRAGVRVQQGGALVLSTDRLLLQLLQFQLSRGCHTCLLGVAGWWTGLRPGGGDSAGRRPWLLVSLGLAVVGRPAALGLGRVGARGCQERDPGLWAAHGGQIRP